MQRLYRSLVFVVGFLALEATADGLRPDGNEAAAPPRATLVVLGDSIAAGFGVPHDDSFPSRLQSRCREAGLPVDVINGGVSGDTTADGLRRIQWLLRRPADCVLIELGGNDGLRGLPPEATRSNLVEIARRVRTRRPTATVVIAGMQMPANFGAEYQAKFAQAFSDAAREAEAVLVPFLLEGVGGVPSLNQPDLIHPNTEGHDRVAANVWKTLEPVLRRVVASKPRSTAP